MSFKPANQSRDLDAFRLDLVQRGLRVVLDGFLVLLQLAVLGGALLGLHLLEVLWLLVPLHGSQDSHLQKLSQILLVRNHKWPAGQGMAHGPHGNFSYEMSNVQM